MHAGVAHACVREGQEDGVVVMVLVAQFRKLVLGGDVVVGL